MRSFLNRYGIEIHEMNYPIKTAYLEVRTIYFVLSNKADKYYSYPRNIAVIEELPFLETMSDFKSILELQAIAGQLPISNNDKILGFDITIYDIILVDMDHNIVYDGLSKQHVDLPRDFFIPDATKVGLYMPYFKSPLKDVKDIILN